MRWIITNLFAVLAVSSFFSSVFTQPTGDIEPWDDLSVDDDSGNGIASYNAKSAYARREITESLPGLSVRQNFESNVGYRATPERVQRPNTDRPNDDGKAFAVVQEGLATTLETIHLESHNHSIVSRGATEEHALSSWFGTPWKKQTFYHFIRAADMDASKRTKFHPNEIKSLAKKGYELIQDRFYFNGNVIVSALFIPNVGVAVGSKPRGTGMADELFNRSHKVSGRYEFVEIWFKKYWDLVYTRDTTDSSRDCVTREELLHAEDLVIIKGADEYLKKQAIRHWGMTLRFPEGTHIVSYGRYNSELGSNSVGPKEPCGGTEKTQLTIPCKNVVHGLGIDWSI